MLRPFHYITFLFIVSILVLSGLWYTGIIHWLCILLPIPVYITLLVLGSIYIRWNFYLYSHCKGKSEKQIALTFDDGPSTETDNILDILKEEEVPAAFFCIGVRVEGKPDTVRRMHEEGHLVGNHSYRHAFGFDWQSSKKMAEEIRTANRAVISVIGRCPLLFRPPYGVTNPNLAKAIRKAKVQSVAWNLRTFDTKARNNNKLLNKTVRKLKGGSIILMHDSMTITREILTDFIHQAREKGFTFVRIDQLLDLKPYA